MARALLLAVCAMVHPQIASAWEFHLYLQCAGQLVAGDQATDADLDLALRGNNQTALVQKSNLLPVGERMSYVPTQLAYAITYKTPPKGSAVYRVWFGGYYIFKTWYPDLQRLAATRLSIDRHRRAAGRAVERR